MFSPSGEFVLTASDDNTAKLWNAATGALLHTFGGHKGSVYSAVFSPQGEFVLTASNDGTAKVWNRANGKVEKVFCAFYGASSYFAIDYTQQPPRWRGRGAALDWLRYRDPNEKPAPGEEAGWEPTQWYAEDLPELEWKD